MSSEETKVLIIDQDKTILDSCIETLADSSLKIATVMDSAFGLEMIKEYQPDLVVVDLNTYGVPGVEALERIREFDPTIVVIATAWATNAFVALFCALNRADFVSNKSRVSPCPMLNNIP